MDAPAADTEKRVCCPHHDVPLEEKEGVTHGGKEYHFWGCPMFGEEGCRYTLQPREYQEALAALQNLSFPGMED